MTSSGELVVAVSICKYLYLCLSCSQLGLAELAQLCAGLMKAIAELVNYYQRGMIFRCLI